VGGAVEKLALQEILDRRTRTSRTYAMPEGSLRTEVSPQSLHHLDAHRAWQRIDNSLMSVGVAGYDCRNLSNRYSPPLPCDLSRRLVELVEGRWWLPEGLAGARGIGTRRGSQATYARALPGVGVSYSAGSDGVEEQLTLRNRGAARSFQYRLQLAPGLQATLGPNGTVEISEGGET
jgi:hypothetical protein